MLRMKRGRRAAAIGAAAIGAAAAVAMLVSVGSASALTRAMPAAAAAPGAGWAPVAFGNAQLSVPGSWLVESPELLSCPFSPPGMIFVGLGPQTPKGSGCGLTASLAWIVPAGHIGLGHRRPTAVIHGIPVYRLHSANGSVLYLVPALGVRIGARGPSARRVLATLTRSPLSVVLRRGPAGPAPANWIWRQFGGIRFAAPRSWALLGEDVWATCGTGVGSRALLLIDATLPPLHLPCPFPVPTAAAEQAVPGLTVVTGKYADKSVGQTYGRCRVRDDVQICVSSITGQGGRFSGVLIFSVSRPRRHAATFFLLGLSGSGTTARAIFTSIKLAS